MAIALSGTELASDPVAAPPQPWVWDGPDAGDLGLYVHIPFCARKCVYCDFNTYAGLEALHDRTVEALCDEIRIRGRQTNRPGLVSVFLGGGTPTLLEPDRLGQLLNAIKSSFNLAPDCEITCEANPNSADRQRFQTLAAGGVNRVSIGAQSFDQAELELLGRWHDAAAIGKAVAAARQAGIDNVSLDLIYGLPSQSPERFQRSLAHALELRPDHLSLYALTVERGTPLARMVRDAEVPEPDDDAAADMYLAAIEACRTAGFTHYEVANWSRTPERHASRHNRLYWRNQSWLGIGPGAHSHRRAARGRTGTSLRWWNLKAVPAYVRCLRDGTSPVAGREQVGPKLSQAESLMLGLRLLEEGVADATFRREHGMGLWERFGSVLEHLMAKGLLRFESERILLTHRGLLFHNRVAEALLPS